jgi:hypothetical protein
MVILLLIKYLFHFIEFSVLEFGVSIKTHLGRESKLYHIESSEISESCSQRHVLIVPAVNTKHITTADDQRAVERSQTENKASNANIAPLSDCLKVSECSKQVNIEEHQNKENENPVAHVKENVACHCYIIPVRNKDRKFANLDSRIEVSDRVCSTVLRDTVNNFKGTSFSQQIKIRMGTKAFRNIHKEGSSSYQKTYATESVIMSDTSKQPSLQDAYVLSKCNFVSTISLT